jgi:hypothetical protein
MGGSTQEDKQTQTSGAQDTLVFQQKVTEAWDDTQQPVSVTPVTVDPQPPSVAEHESQEALTSQLVANS